MNPDETRERILAAADELFGALGFDATTTRDISDKSGVNKALIHYHFGSKDDLLHALLERHYAALGVVLQGAMAQAHTPREQMHALVDAYSDFLAAHHSFARIIQREIASGRHTQRIVERTLPMFELGVAWVRATQAKPPPGLDAVNLLVTAYGMVVTWFTAAEVLRQLTGKDPLARAALAARKKHVKQVLDLLFGELGADLPS
ncbi:MAG: TetR/AcrR family transcriptional regulator [Deltaproteobacteria bacterium]|nr:TetR/AcrR family transcriptional regulator [Deltaproteobacteria bacterium]